MEGLWFVSYIALWFVATLEGLILIVALRQIGVIYMRIGPRGALAEDIGPKVGEKVPKVIQEDLDGQLVNIGTETKHDTLLVFISAKCSACRNILPGITTLSDNRDKEDIEIVLMSAGDQWPHQDGQKRIKGVHYVVFPDYINTFKIGATPYALLIDKQGKVLTKGIINNIENLESLLNARDIGAPTAADLVRMKGSDQKKSVSKRE